MKEIDFYGVLGKNVNKFFDLGLNAEEYYSWDYIKERVDEKILSVENPDILRDVMGEFGLVMVGRKSREERIRSELERRGVEFRKHSYLVRNYVMYARGNLWDIVKTMYKMKILFENCDIREKWENHKVRSGGQIYTFGDKDKFYEDEYNKYVDANPHLRY